MPQKPDFSQKEPNNAQNEEKPLSMAQVYAATWMALYLKLPDDKKAIVDAAKEKPDVKDKWLDEWVQNVITVSEAAYDLQIKKLK